MLEVGLEEIGDQEMLRLPSVENVVGEPRNASRSTRRTKIRSWPTWRTSSSSEATVPSHRSFNQACARTTARISVGSGLANETCPERPGAKMCCWPPWNLARTGMVNASSSSAAAIVPKVPTRERKSSRRLGAVAATLSAIAGVVGSRRRVMALARISTRRTDRRA